MSDDHLSPSDAPDLYPTNYSDDGNGSLYDNYEEYSGPFDYPHIKAIFMTAYITVFTVCVIGKWVTIGGSLFWFDNIPSVSESRSLFNSKQLSGEFAIWVSKHHDTVHEKFDFYLSYVW